MAVTAGMAAAANGAETWRLAPLAMGWAAPTLVVIFRGLDMEGLAGIERSTRHWGKEGGDDVPVGGRDCRIHILIHINGQGQTMKTKNRGQGGAKGDQTEALKH